MAKNVFLSFTNIFLLSACWMGHNNTRHTKVSKPCREEANELLKQCSESQMGIFVFYSPFFLLKLIYFVKNNNKTPLWLL